MTRMHSSRMRTAHSSSHWGGLPQCMLGCTPWVWAWRPPRCGPGDPSTWVWGVGLETLLGVGLETTQARPLNFPLGCGPGDPPSQTPQLLPWVWAWTPARHAGIPLETCCQACCDTTCNACWDTTSL